MTREIKFRAWDKKNKAMVYPIIIWNHSDEGSDYMFPAFSGIKYDDINDISEMMQYTGLKDKNGKEIYEGDILSMHNGQYNSQVVWDTDRYIADHIGNGGSESITTFIEDLEIIGNIYENPELLKKYDK